jgi:hypothetical protein
MAGRGARRESTSTICAWRPRKLRSGARRQDMVTKQDPWDTAHIVHLPTGIRVAALAGMPGLSLLPVDDCLVADASGFDLSDIDEVDIGGELSFDKPRSARAERADLSDDVLAMCALLVFQDRPRKALHRAGPCGLPGL